MELQFCKPMESQILQYLFRLLLDIAFANVIRCFLICDEADTNYKLLLPIGVGFRVLYDEFVTYKMRIS